MNSLWSSRAPSESVEEGTSSADTADIDAADVERVPETSPAQSEPLSTDSNPSLPTRPLLRRDLSQPPPPAPMPPSADPPPGTSLPASSAAQHLSQPPPAPQPTDSLSLMQLRRIVAEFKQPELVAYDFVYSDAGPHGEEIDEWFVYQFWQWVRLNAVQRAFEWHWQHVYKAQTTWDDADAELKTRFLAEALEGVKSDDSAHRAACIGRIVYLILGRWADTAEVGATVENSKSVASRPQLAAMQAGVELLASLDGIEVVWEALRSIFEYFWYDSCCSLYPAAV